MPNILHCKFEQLRSHKNVSTSHTFPQKLRTKNQRRDGYHAFFSKQKVKFSRTPARSVKYEYSVIFNSRAWTGHSHLPSIYRPIRITSVFCKVLEKIFLKRWCRAYLRTIHCLKHSLVKSRYKVNWMSESMNWQYDKGNHTDVIYLDYSKCLDTIVHIKLMFKLGKYGFEESAYNWIK